MKLLLLQTDIRWHSPRENRHRIEGLVEAAPKADLVVLPEMFTTGFTPDPAGATEKDGAETLAWMQKTASRHDAAVAGSVAVEEGGRYYNRFYFVKPDGIFIRYDKRHLFSFGGEDRHYTAGTERVVIEWRGWRILLQVCYDLRFPVFARNRGDYDLILYPANWPTVRLGAWNALLRARAIENLCYVAGVNRTGEDPFTKYSGGTALIDFKGGTVAEAGKIINAEIGEVVVAGAASNSEQAVFCRLDKAALTAFRNKFPALDDSDDFKLIINK